MDNNIYEQIDEQGVQIDYIEEVKLAWRQWQSTISFFENVTEPELVEVAIYSMEAARRKYVYMINNVDKYLNDNTKKALLRYKVQSPQNPYADA